MPHDFNDSFGYPWQVMSMLVAVHVVNNEPCTDQDRSLCLQFLGQAIYIQAPSQGRPG
jgi:hypothetical protein